MRRLARWAAATLIPARVLVTRASPAGSCVSLTFDDGPDEKTRKLLDRLDELSVRATFFVVGERCAERPDDVLEIIRRGHEVASHGYTHTRFPLMTQQQLFDELDRTDALLPVPNRRRPLIRPPGGHTTMTSLYRLYRRGYTVVLWSADSRDAETQDPAEVAACAGKAEAGDIVLLHEGQDWTVAALPKIVEALRARGLSTTTVGEMI